MRNTKKILAVLMIAVFMLSTAVLAADKHMKKVMSFESGTTEGWHGANKWVKSCSVVTHEKATDGTKMLKVDVAGSKDWNQDLMVFDGPFGPEFKKSVGLFLDIYVPDASLKGMKYQELYLVVSGKANAWYQLKAPLEPGLNNVHFKLDNSKMDTDLWHMYLILNNSEPWAGPIYIDNITVKVQGEPGSLKGKAIDKKSGKGIADALVVLGDSLTKTDGSGNFKMTVPEDTYKMEIVKFGYKKKNKSGVEVVANKTSDIGSIEINPENKQKVSPATINVSAGKVIRTIDPHKMYGENLAAWHPTIGYRDNEAISRIKDLNATMIRIPGGDYGNQYDWKTGDVYKHDGSVNWTPELNYFGGMVPFMKRMDREVGGNKMAVMPILNIMTPAKRSIQERIEYNIQWLQDMKNKGIRYQYVEVGNEPDSKNDVPGPSDEKNWLKSPTSQKNQQWFTRISNYSKVFNQVAYQVKKAFPGDNLKLMGPCPMQPMNKQRLAGEPWKAEQENPTSPYWVEDFLKYSGKYVDAIAVHEYPLWANNNAVALLKKPVTNVPEYMRNYRKWIKKYVNSQKGYENKYIEVALTEWNSGEENVMTAILANGIFCADYLGNFIKEGGDLALIWDLYTQKPGMGGGHGLMDAENDPTDKFSRRSHYWVIQMFANHFGTKIVKSTSDNDDLDVFTAIDKNNKLTIMAVNKTKLKAVEATINVEGKGVGGGKAYQLSEKEYVWSKGLYRPIVNTGPSELRVNGGKNFTYTFPPYSVTCIVLD